MTYRSYADEYIKDRKSEIEKVILNEKYDSIQKINFLLREEIKEFDYLNPTKPVCCTPIKTKILSYLNSNSFVKYLDSSESDSDYLQTHSQWEKNKRTLIYTNRTSAKTFVADNTDVIPMEIQYCFRKKGTKKLNDIPKEQLAGTIIGMLEIRDYVQEEINHIIKHGAIHESMHQELKDLLQNKIFWDKDVNTIGFLAIKLISAGYISYPIRSSRPQIAQLISAHFDIKGSAGRNASLKSIVNAISNAEKLKNDIHTKLIEALQYTPKKKP